jgi:beta-galactosidase
MSCFIFKSGNIKCSFAIQLWLLAVMVVSGSSPSEVRKTENFNKNWKFTLGDMKEGQSKDLDDSKWRKLDLPHDWSIEGTFSKDNPATPSGGALPGGVGWYRKSFALPQSDKDKLISVEFDGIYRNSEVWINGQYLGKRPYGFSSFMYDLTPFVKFGRAENIIAVRVDNSQQPNSRWYSGSGIYRNVRLVTTGKICVEHWGTFVTSEVTGGAAKVSFKIKVHNELEKGTRLVVTTSVTDREGRSAGTVETKDFVAGDNENEVLQTLTIRKPELWSLENPYLYTGVTTVKYAGKVLDKYETIFGIRQFRFDADKGFILNDKPVKIRGVCNHHDLGCLGAAFNKRALERQLEILKGMGCNGIRTSHNPPAPELLDLCDRMGFIVMDEAFDMWKKKKTDFDYSLDWDKWHVRDLQDLVLRDRNHPSVFIWSIGNEVVEQWDRSDSSGTVIARELTGIIRSLDATRPITSNMNDPVPMNPVIKSEALDLIGFSYYQKAFPDFPKTYPGKKFIGSETTSALETRGHYDMPSDSIRRWPVSWDKPLLTGNPDNTCSAYDNVSAPWGSTHEETWKLIKKYDFLSGMYIWTGFDYLGEPTPYGWPSRSSYFGIVDLAGFPKDIYYMYQSEWTGKPVLHLFPHWNWKPGQKVDLWVFSNCDEVELFLNGKSLGTKRKTGDDLHLAWQVNFVPGTVKAVGRSSGKEVLTQVIKTAKGAAKIELIPDRKVIAADGQDLSFVTVKILDADGTPVPDADNLINFKISGEGSIAGVDNGLETSLEPFISDHHKAFNGLCLAVIRSKNKGGVIKLKATSEGLKEASVTIESK